MHGWITRSGLLVAWLLAAIVPSSARFERAWRAWVISVDVPLAQPAALPTVSEAEVWLPIERQAFVARLPSWKRYVDLDAGSSGALQVERPGRSIRIAWQVGGRSRPRSKLLAQRSAKVLADFGTHLHFPPDLREQTQAVGSRYKGGYRRVTDVECIPEEIIVRLTVFTPSKDETRQLSDRVLGYLSCREQDPSTNRMHWPSTDLPADFGVVEDSILALADGEGRELLIYARLPDEVERELEKMERRDKGGLASTWRGDTTRVYRRYGKLLGSSVSSTFVCEDIGLGYFVFASDPSHDDVHAELEQLVLRIGCPRPGDPSILARPSACAAGASAWCDQATIAP